jgi:hypothetical protein
VTASWVRRASTIAVWGLVAFSPGVLTFLLVNSVFETSVAGFVPNYWNDQVAYWHKIASFARVGFETGYYSPDEIDMPFDAIRYSVNGPWMPALYGSLAAVFGWSLVSSIYVNIAVLATGILVFLGLTRLDILGSLLTGLVVVTTWPVLLYVPTVSQESLNQALALVLAGILVRAVRQGADLSLSEKVTGVTLITAAALFRFSWSILLPVLIVLFARNLTARRIAFALLAGGMLAVAAMGVTSLLQPPGHNSAIDALRRTLIDPTMGSSELARTTAENLKRLLFPGFLDPTAEFVVRGSPLSLTGVQSWLILGVTLVALVTLGIALRKVHPSRVLHTMRARESLFHAINLGAVTAAALVLYLASGYFRVLGAHLLASAVVLVAMRRHLVVTVLVAANLSMLPDFLNHYERWEPNFTLDPISVERERERVSRFLQYDDAAHNGWCNTLVLPVDLFDWRVVVVPPGIGISYALTDDQPDPPRSRYVMLDRARSALREGPFDTSRLKRLGSFSGGSVFENPASECFRG